MRIIAGTHRGLALAAVGKGDAGAHLRPTSDRVRESLFSVLSGGRCGDPVTDARVLDLFAGTGALGLEALSRGAKNVTFVDNGRTSQQLIRRNIDICDRLQDVTILKCDATKLPVNSNDPFTLVFLDPPYGKGRGEQALITAERNGWIEPNAVIVWEESAEMPQPPGFEKLDARRYGDTWITLLGYSPQVG